MSNIVYAGEIVFHVFGETPESPDPTPPPANSLLLEAWLGGAIRKTLDGTIPLWTTTLNGNQFISLDAAHHQLVCTVEGVSSDGHGMAVNFATNGSTDSFSFPHGFAQSYLQTSGFSASTSYRMKFRIKSSKVPSDSFPGNNLDINSYCKGHSFVDADGNGRTRPGQHFTWGCPVLAYADEWFTLYVDMQTSHVEGQDDNQNVCYDPEFDSWRATIGRPPSVSFPDYFTTSNTALSNKTPIHFFDGLTQFYVTDNNGTFPTAWTFDPIYWEVIDDSKEPLDNTHGSADKGSNNLKLVSNVSAIYHGTGYELRWCAPKNVRSQTYQVSYSASNMKTNGLASGTLNSQIISAPQTSSQTSYQGCKWIGPAMARGAWYFAIKPIENNHSNYFVQIQSP